MKKGIYILFSIIILSCSSSSENNFNETSIYGFWKLTSIQSTTLNSCQLNNTDFEFFSNNDLLTHVGVLEQSTCVVDEYNQTFSITNNVLTINEYDNNNLIFQSKSNIIQLNSNTLKIKTYYTKEVVFNTIYEDNIPESERKIEEYTKQ